MMRLRVTNGFKIGEGGEIWWPDELERSSSSLLLLLQRPREMADPHLPQSVRLRPSAGRGVVREAEEDRCAAVSHMILAREGGREGNLSRSKRIP